MHDLETVSYTHLYIFQNGKYARIEETVAFLVIRKRMEGDREHIGGSVSEHTEISIEYRELAFGIEPAENFYFFKTKSDSLLN